MPQTRLRIQQKATPAPSHMPVRSVLQRKCACGGSPGVTGECAECSRKRLVSQPPLLQTKLSIGRAGDKYEQEADRVADQVMRMSGNTAASNQPSAVSQRKSIQTKHAPSPHAGEGWGEGDSASPIVYHVLHSSGESLDPGTRTFMESRFGHDFSQVRVHRDAKAAESARAVNALAYTVGEDVVFGTGQYAPGSSTGQRLLAHELTHVVQQGEAQSRTLTNIDRTLSAQALSATLANGVVTRRELVVQREPRADNTLTSAGCPEWTFSGITQSVFDCMRGVFKKKKVTIPATNSGIVVGKGETTGGPIGSPVKMDFQGDFKWNEKTGVVTIKVTENKTEIKPPFFSYRPVTCEELKGSLDGNIKECKEK
jgi:Domain of unknown function (DUF4157)